MLLRSSIWVSKQAGCIKQMTSPSMSLWHKPGHSAALQCRHHSHLSRTPFLNSHANAHHSIFPTSSNVTPRLLQGNTMEAAYPTVSCRSYCYDVRTVDITSGKQTFIFDTHKAITLLQESGMTLREAESVVELIAQVMAANMDHMNKSLVTKPQQEITVQQMLSHMAALKKDMIILEKSEFSQLKHEYEKQSIELKQMKAHLQDELNKVKSGVMLDLNLEKSRAKEAHHENVRDVSTLQNKLDMTHSDMDKGLSLVNSKIDKEIATLLATYERYRNDIMKYAAGTILTCLTICLGFYRIWM